MAHDKGTIRLKDDDAKQFLDEEVGSKVTLTVSGILELTSVEKEVDYDDEAPVAVGGKDVERKPRIIPRARIRVDSISAIDTKPVKRRDI